MGKLNDQLNTEDIRRLVLFVKQDCGDALSKDEFAEVILLMAEDIPGCVLGPQDESELIDVAYLMYCELNDN